MSAVLTAVIDIDATPQAVWDVLLMTPKNDGYAAFNKALEQRVEGRTELRATELRAQ